MWAYLVILIHLFTTRCAKGGPAFAAEPIFKKECNAAPWTYTTELGLQNLLHFCTFGLLFIIFYQRCPAMWANQGIFIDFLLAFRTE
jgi:hypothetical protein